MASGIERARHHLRELRETLQASAAGATDDHQQQLVERLLSHYEAGPSGPSADSAASQLRAQMCSLGLLSRNVQLPDGLLRRAGVNKRELEDEGNSIAALVRDARQGSISVRADPQGTEPQRRELAVAAIQQVKARAAGARRADRIEELKSVPSHVPQEVALKALIELKSLKLKSLQTALRKDVAHEQQLLQTCRPDVLMDWGSCRRADPKPDIPEPDLTQKDTPAPAPQAPQVSQSQQQEIARRRMEEARLREEAQIRAEHAKHLKAMRQKLEAEKKQRNEDALQLRRQIELKQRLVAERRAFCNEIFVHHRDALRPLGQKIQKGRAARNTHVKAFHRRQGDKVTREQNARIAALKEDNYEEYLKLAANTKNLRLRTLFEKTTSILEEMGLKVHDQRSAMLEEEDGGDNMWLDGTVAPAASPGLDSQARSMIQGQRQYYDMVHVVKEQVEAPAMLVGGTLRHYQLGGLKFLMSLYNNNMNGILADEMGLGKTIQTISFLASLMEKKNNLGPHLILAPKAVLSNWSNEFIKWAPDIAVINYDGSPDERKQLQRDHVEKGTFNILITHYDLIMRDKSALRKVQWDLLIVDEGHRLKNAESRLAEILRSYSFRHRILLTGTPIQNSLGELWSLLNFVLPRVFNSSETFDEWFAAPFRGQSENVSEQLNEEEQLLVISRLHQVMRPFMLRRTKREVEKELPSKTEHVIKCAMSAWQKTLYQQITDNGRIHDNDKAPRSLQNAAMQLRKTCNHPYLFLDPSYHPSDPQELIRASGKLDLLDRILPMLHATGHRVLLFSQMTRALDMVEDFLLLRHFPYLRLDGRTKADARANMLSDFNKPDSPYFIFALSTRAGGLGLNLQTADTVIMFDSDWNPQMDQQAEDRAHRIGQKREVLVLVLVSAGTIEQVILDRAQQKKEIDAKVIQAGMFNDKSTHKERQEALQTVMRRGDVHLGEQVHSPAALNKLLARTPEEYKLFQQMQETRAETAGERSGLMTQSEVPSWVTGSAPSDTMHEQVPAEEQGTEEGLLQRRRRSSTTGVQYSEDVSDAAFNRLLQADEASDDSASEDEVLPARRVSKSKSREATPAELLQSDSEDNKALVSLLPSPAKKTRLKKKPPQQQPEAGSSRKRQKRLSQTPEPSSSGLNSADAKEDDGHNGSQLKQASVASSSGQKQSQAGVQEGTSPEKGASQDRGTGHKGKGRTSRAESSSPAPKPQRSSSQKSVRGRGRPASKPPAGRDGNDGQNEGAKQAKQPA